jgi:hypothetical protein
MNRFGTPGPMVHAGKEFSEAAAHKEQNAGVPCVLQSMRPLSRPAWMKEGERMRRQGSDRGFKP